MKKSTGKPTKAQVERFEAMQEIGCIACRKMGNRGGAEIHHLNLGGKAGQKRRGHDFTIPLCAWHHRGVPMPGLSVAWTTLNRGPSLSTQSRLFRAAFGTDDELLAEVNKLIGVAV